MESRLIPVNIGYDLGEADCSRVGYMVPEHGDKCPRGSGLQIVRENQLDWTGTYYSWTCDGCGQKFSIGMTLNSPDDL